MIANFATILIGLWLAYRAIFSLPAGNVNQIELVVAGVALILLALWARRTDLMRWHSGTNIVLAVIIRAARRRAPGRWGRPTGIVLDDPPHWNRDGYHGGVVDSVSA